MANVTEALRKLNFIEKVLPKLIVERNEEFAGYEVVNCVAELIQHLDGFMSSLYNVDLTLKAPEDEKPQSHKLILKIMKGDENFRTLSKSMLQCSNEVFIYKTVIPYFRKFLKENNSTSFNPDQWWTPRVYFADTGKFPDLSDGIETVLAMENLKPLGFRMGPSIDLDEGHLRLMIENIAYYHSVSYAMKIKNDPNVKAMSAQLAPFSFLSETGEEMQSYKRLFEVGLERLFNLIEKDERYRYSEKFVADVKKLKEKYGRKPLILMESFLKYDEIFTIFLHGDYNRNNVLFLYDALEGFENPKKIKMFDFQETRFASPVIDLVFFMYMNIHFKDREQLWDSLLEQYHRTMMSSLIDLLKCEKDDPKLKPYSFDNFIDHFKKHAFYGVTVCLHYVPWIASPKEECAQIAHWFETDMNSDEFYKICQVCGGEEVDERIVSIVKHASDKGYMEVI